MIRKALIGLSMLLLPSLVSAESPTFIIGGDSITAGKLIDLVEIDGHPCAQVKNSRGDIWNLPLSQLSSEDVAITKKFALQMDVSNRTVLQPNNLQGHLVSLVGNKLSPYQQTGEIEFYLFYFSGGWCPPCRTFTPELIEKYRGWKSRGLPYEVIFVSSDKSADEMLAYMQESGMPWPAIRYEDLPEVKGLRRLSGPGIPCLTMTDFEGEILSHTYQGDTYLGPWWVLTHVDSLTMDIETAGDNGKTNFGATSWGEDLVSGMTLLYESLRKSR